jgi:hypothetical protein
LSRTAAPLLLALLAALCLPACISDSLSGDMIRSNMLDSAPEPDNAKVVTLRVEDRRGRLVVGQYVISDLERMRGVWNVRRGRGRNEVYVLCEKWVRASSLGAGLPPECRATVVDVRLPGE